MVVIKDPQQLQLYVFQNESPDIRRRREIRMTLRALNGRKVTWPYKHVQVTLIAMPSMYAQAD
jgi:hypothetical protein